MSENTFKMPEKWKDLTARQKEVLEKNYPLNKLISFFLPKIWLIYAKKGGTSAYLFFSMLIVFFSRKIPSFITGLLCLIYIFSVIDITSKNREICYHGRKKEMEKTLLKYRNKWDETLPDYDNGEIKSNVNKLRWIGTILSLVFCSMPILLTIFQPPLQGAQDIARDTTRQTNLYQLQVGISSYKTLKGIYPTVNSQTAGKTSELTTLIDEGFLTELPKDPIINNINTFKGLSTVGDYVYFYEGEQAFLIAKTETPHKSNFVCSDEKCDVNLSSITLCKNINKGTKVNNDGKGNCTYTDENQLKYILKF